jgi:hypothetical protein
MPTLQELRMPIRRAGHMECTTAIMTTKATTYIVCDHCGSVQSLTPESSHGVDPDGRAHQAMDLPCSACGRPGATTSTEPAGTDALRRISERENGLAS